jgi:hypothetical protein
MDNGLWISSVFKREFCTGEEREREGGRGGDVVF